MHLNSELVKSESVAYDCWKSLKILFRNFFRCYPKEGSPKPTIWVTMAREVTMIGL